MNDYTITVVCLALVSIVAITHNKQELAQKAITTIAKIVEQFIK